MNKQHIRVLLSSLCASSKAEDIATKKAIHQDNASPSIEWCQDLTDVLNELDTGLDFQIDKIFQNHPLGYINYANLS